MEFKSLYNKWRPAFFSDVSGQEHVTLVLKNQVAAGRVSHAYLFFGSRGTGKTTCARILAKAVNCLNPRDGDPCNVCEACEAINKGSTADVIEVDAASNNGVDSVRDLREQVKYMPSALKKKVYIIDEVHMLSGAAFNALLKTLEEPPAHVIFIFATTEQNKLPATILSRVQRHNFKRITPEVIAARLAYIAKEEGITAQAEALSLMARLSGGAMRDAIGFLEVCAASADGGPITFEGVAALLGLSDRSRLIDLTEAVSRGDAAAALEVFWELHGNSREISGFLSELLDLLRDLQFCHLTKDPSAYLELPEDECKKLAALAAKFKPRTLIALSDMVGEALRGIGRYTAGGKTAAELLIIKAALYASGGMEQPPPLAAQPAAAPIKAAAAPGAAPQPTQPAAEGPKPFDKFAEFMESFEKDNPILAAFLKSASCAVDAQKGEVIFAADHPMVKKLAELPDNDALIKRHMKAVTGLDLRVIIK